jgi:hypothetical protein
MRFRGGSYFEADRNPSVAMGGNCRHEIPDYDIDSLWNSDQKEMNASLELFV